MKLNLMLRSNRRGVTPVIATVLLIGLVVVAGIGIAFIMFSSINAPDPLGVKIVSISDFESTDNDFLVDKFSITLQNTERTNVRIESNAFNLMFRNLTSISGWDIDLSFTEFFLPSLAIQTIPLSCDPFGDQLTPKNDTIYIEITVYPEDSTNPRSSKTFKSDLFQIGDTFGPVYLASLLSTTTLDVGGLNLSFNVGNNGSSELNLFLEFSTDSPERIFFVINGINQTTHFFSVKKYSVTNFIDIFTIKPIPPNTIGEKYFILISLWNSDNMKLIATTSFILTYGS